MAVINPQIRVVTIDGALFQDEVDQRQIMAVPTTFLNGEVFGQGRTSVEEILARLDSNAGTRKAAQLDAKEAFDVLIVGGGPAGAAAAVYAARKGIRTGVVAERFGGQVLDTLGIENYISVVQTEGPQFATALEQHVKAYDVDIMNLQTRRAADPQSGHGTAWKSAWPVGRRCGAARSSCRPAPAGAISTCRANRNTATGAWPTARIVTALCSRASASP